MQSRPVATAEEAARIAEEHFGLEGTASPLPGERDLNFLLTDREGARFVVKMTSPEESDAALTFETGLLAWLGEREDVPTPGVIRTRGGDLVARLSDGEGGHRVRVLPFIPGAVMASIRPWTDDLLIELGRSVARLDRVLEDHPTPPPPRPDFDWSLDNAARVIRRGLEILPGDEVGEHRKRLLTDVLETVAGVESVVAGLPRQLIHGDVNEHNVLVSVTDDGRASVSALLDFGDAHEAPAVFDAAIAVAYSMLGQKDPLAAACAVARGYHATRPLTEGEVDALLPLARARLAASVSISTWRRRAAGEGGEVDPYLTVSESPAWTTLEALHSIHPRVAGGLLRDVCGYPPSPRSPALVAWLEGMRGSCAPVMDVPTDGGTVVLDLSVGSPLLNGRDTEDTPAFSRRVFRHMEDAGASVGIGRYDEPRGFYLTETFAGRAGELPERRTVHLGIDIFHRPGAEVRSPLPARVHGVHDNEGRLDYGPTVILEHDSPEGPFWTLYGHLERASLAGLEVGVPLEAGETFARIGPYPENGDWPPHLHFQIIADLLDHSVDFPGVALPRERRVWTSLSPDPDLILGVDLPTTYVDAEAPEERRRRALGPTLSLSYRRPIHVVRGAGAHLYDDLGREYLDCVNNVAHVGHEHPRVVAAGQAQMGVLNTNTRYLHEEVVAYAEELVATLPEPLSVCWFVNSGSEANELALRLARSHTGGRGVVVLESGYHGNTQGLVDVSHYKFARAGGEGPPPWVEAAALPDDYRGRFRRDDPRRATRYADTVGECCAALEARSVRTAAFLAESILSCGGQIDPPEGYLALAYAHARASGAVCIADEVQIGFGRVGSHFWGFEAHGVVPDIVTLGKPMGNGHPMGAVVTTREVASSFVTGMEFFSTFGGNPVSAAIGRAVLRVIHDEGLQAHADAVGGELRAGLEALMERHPGVGDVRGRGLFLGIEIVRPGDDPVPDAATAYYVKERARERGVLLSTDGPDDNVIKIKPPMVFARDHARRLVDLLDEILGEHPVPRRR
ncbi:MAG: aminotransferase class III-fold pyridoxal phosphate-dependent enzyme [Gemmatimonadota bacterium]|nr:aminotransferase class III-fold pyridoxal phosphate-dependent enzyme [Gemmatimonadota bacterium]